MAPWPFPACAYGRPKAELNYYRLICKLEFGNNWPIGVVVTISLPVTEV